MEREERVVVVVTLLVVMGMRRSWRRKLREPLMNDVDENDKIVEFILSYRHNNIKNIYIKFTLYFWAL